MDEHTLYGKKKLCYIEVTDFTDFQGIGSHPLYKRFDSVYSVVKTNIDQKYWDFLAHPIYSDDDQILWYVREWHTMPSPYNELTGAEKIKYTEIKNRTLAEYNRVLSALSGEDKQILSGALTHIDEDFMFCYDDKITVIAWGMYPDSQKHIIKGGIIHDLKIQNKYKIEFIAGEYGSFDNELDGIIKRPEGYSLVEADIPHITPKSGYVLKSWEPNPINVKVNNTLVFTAVYEEVPVIEKKKVTFSSGYGGYINGPTELYIDKGSCISEYLIPSCVADDGFEFERWDGDIYTPIENDITFTALFAQKNVKCTFLSSDCGNLQGESHYTFPYGTILSVDSIPAVNAKRGYKFIGWDKSPVNYELTEDTTFTAKYEKLPWYKRLWAWLTGKGCLKWLLWLLLAILLIGLIWLLVYIWPRFFSHKEINGVAPITQIEGPEGPIDINFPEPQIGEDVPIVGQPEFGKFYPIVGDDGLLPEEDIIAPIIDNEGDRVPIIRDPDGKGEVIANRLAIFFEDAEVDLNAFVADLCQNYNCEVIGMDKNIPMIQIQVPESERVSIRESLNQKGRISGYNFFVVDEQIVDMRNASSPAGNLSGNISQDKIGWHLKAVKVNNGWNLFTKGDRDIVVAVVDDGIDSSHELFKDRIVKAYNIFTKDNRLSKGSGHGTHVAGLAVGSDIRFSEGVSGIAPNCSIMPIQVFDNAYASTSSLASGIMYAINNGADVINASFGLELDSEFAREISSLPISQQEELANIWWNEQERVWKLIIEIANKRNAIIVFAAGNNHILAKICPTIRSNSTINVAAVDPEYSDADFSNFGKGANVSAPGKDIISSLPGNNYGNMDGTSMAAPIVTGTVALMKSLKKDITVDEVINIFNKTGRKVSGPIPPMIQVDAALALLMGRPDLIESNQDEYPVDKKDPKPIKDYDGGDYNNDIIIGTPHREKIIIEITDPNYEEIRRFIDNVRQR